jgi:hypothetical protein
MCAVAFASGIAPSAKKNCKIPWTASKRPNLPRTDDLAEVTELIESLRAQVKQEHRTSRMVQVKRFNNRSALEAVEPGFLLNAEVVVYSARLLRKKKKPAGSAMRGRD